MKLTAAIDAERVCRVFVILIALQDTTIMRRRNIDSKTVFGRDFYEKI